MNKLTVRAAAKINLCLHVLGRREDGYHELAMAMQRVSLFDDIHLSLTSEQAVSVCCDGLELEKGGENIAAKAARLLFKEKKTDCGVEITITKRIPVAAGLGGGSSDAAAVLTGLNELLQLGLSRRVLMGLGAQLGADVPFFIFAAPAWATGTGTTLEALPSLPSVAYLLVNPGFGVSTAAVYQSLRLTKGGHLANLPRFSAVTSDDLCANLHNDLERVTLDRYPEINEVKKQLMEQGALGALMSGSGATVFGVFEDIETATRVGNILKAQTRWKVFPVKPLGDQ